MQPNFFHMAMDISAFLTATLLFMLVVFFYRKSTTRILGKVSPWLEKHLRQQHFIKLSFIFAALYFSFFIIHHHSGIGCEDLDESGHCQCYALKIIRQGDMKQKLHWANNALRMCPDSKFFSDFLKKHSS